MRALFRLYVELGSVRCVKEEADRRGLRSKVRERSDQRMRGGNLLSRGHIYRLLSSPIYAGYVPHKGERYEGQHPAIIDLETWEAVQRRLAERAPARGRSRRSVREEPLVGKLFDESGLALTLSHTVKGSRRYRYCVSRCEDEGDRGWRLPAQEIERVVEDAVTALLAHEPELARVARDSGVTADRVDHLLHEVARWDGKPLDLVSRVDLGRGRIVVHMDLSSVHGLGGVVLHHAVDIRLRRRGVEAKLVLAGGEQPAATARADPALVKAVLRAHAWFERLATGRGRDRPR